MDASQSQNLHGPKQLDKEFGVARQMVDVTGIGAGEVRHVLEALPIGKL
jgi:hypothetical protein